MRNRKGHKVNKKDVEKIWSLVNFGISNSQISKITGRSYPVIVTIKKSKGDYEKYRSLMKSRLNTYKKKIQEVQEKVAAEPTQQGMNFTVADIQNLASQELEVLNGISDKLDKILEGLDQLSVRF